MINRRYLKERNDSLEDCRKFFRDYLAERKDGFSFDLDEYRSNYKKNIDLKPAGLWPLALKSICSMSWTSVRCVYYMRTRRWRVGLGAGELWPIRESFSRYFSNENQKTIDYRWLKSETEETLLLRMMSGCAGRQLVVILFEILERSFIGCVVSLWAIWSSEIFWKRIEQQFDIRETDYIKFALNFYFRLSK